MSHKISLVLFSVFVAGLCIAPLAESQSTGPTRNLPAISYETNEKDVKRFPRYFISHKVGVDFSTASLDIDECLRYGMGPNEAGIQMFPPIPDFVPLEEAQSFQDGPPKAHSGEFGLVGDVMAAMIVPGVNRTIAQASVRRCMGYKNYDRYGISKEAWKTLNEADHGQRVIWLAQIASGPTPKAVKVSK